MTTQSEIKETLEIIKGKKVFNVDLKKGYFETEKCAHSFELTKVGLVKANSIKFLWTLSEYANCSYGL